MASGNRTDVPVFCPRSYRPVCGYPEWIAAAQAFRKKSAALAVVFDFQLPESGSFNLQTGCQLVHAGLDGKNITLEIR